MSLSALPAFPKPNIVRLKGKKMEALRIACFLRDGGRCMGCTRQLALEPVGYLPVMHMAHIKNKRMYGDTLNNVRALCPRCHLVDSHNPKSVPPKNPGLRP